MLVAHCKALEARGPIASHSAGPPGPAALLLALEGQASSAVTRRLPALHQHPHRHQHHQQWINERHESLTGSPTRPYAASTGQTLAHTSWDWLTLALPGGVLPLKVPLGMIR